LFNLYIEPLALIRYGTSSRMHWQLSAPVSQYQTLSLTIIKSLFFADDITSLSGFIPDVTQAMLGARSESVVLLNCCIVSE
jgi:hypothetical protein